MAITFAGRQTLKLNLGCGSNKMPGYVNVDLYGEPDVRQDLESFPWPWVDSSVEEIYLSHVLEHLGAAPNVFIQIMKEMYRVSANGAKIHIIVPHPRHDHYLGDPTHVRPVTPQMLALFDRAQCETWQAKGYSNTPLALFHGVDFQMIECAYVLDQKYQNVPPKDIEQLMNERNNVCAEIRMVFQVRK